MSRHPQCFLTSGISQDSFLRIASVLIVIMLCSCSAADNVEKRSEVLVNLLLNDRDVVIEAVGTWVPRDSVFVCSNLESSGQVPLPSFTAENDTCVPEIGPRNYEATSPRSRIIKEHLIRRKERQNVEAACLNECNKLCPWHRYIVFIDNYNNGEVVSAVMYRINDSRNSIVRRYSKSAYAMALFRKDGELCWYTTEVLSTD